MSIIKEPCEKAKESSGPGVGEEEGTVMLEKNYWAKMQRERISRRRLLGAAGVGAAGLAIAAACGDDGGSGGNGTPSAQTDPTAVLTPQPGGRYKQTTAVISDALFGLDPHLSIAAGLNYFARMYNVLINRSAVDPNFVLNDLASNLETPDETTYIFTIRPGVKIAPNALGIDERDMDAEDALVTFQRIKDQPLANSCQFVCQYFASDEATDPMTYRVQTTKPYAWFEFNIGRAISTIPPREMIQVEDGARMRENGVGGGPFYISAFTEGESVSLEKNPNYYKPGRPYMDGWDVTIIPDRAALRAAFLAQDSYQYGAATDAEVDELVSANDVYKASDDPTYTYISFTMNVTKPPWTDPRVRNAALYAVNRQDYIDIIYQGAARANGLVHWAVTGALSEEELQTLQPFDPERSKQLLQDAGHELPLSIDVVFPTGPTQEHESHLPIWIRQMEQAGFKINQVPKDIGAWLNDYRNLDYDSSLALNQIYETAEIPLDFHHSRGPAGSEVFATGLQDPAIDAVIDATKGIIDFDERVAAIQDAQRQIYEAGPTTIPLVTPFSRTLYWDFVKNVPTGLGTTGLFLTDGMWLSL